MTKPKFDTALFLDDVQERSKEGKLALLMAGMRPDEAEALERVLRDETIPARRISKALKTQGFDVGPHPVDTWRLKNLNGSVDDDVAS